MNRKHLSRQKMSARQKTLAQKKVLAQKKTRGFTLIEVIVALTLTGFLLGGLFALVAGSKQLSWRAEQSLLKAMQQRAAWNYALLDNDNAELDAILEEEHYTMRELDDIDIPDRQTQPMSYQLQVVELRSEQDDVEAVATRWAKLQVGDSAQ